MDKNDVFVKVVVGLMVNVDVLVAEEIDIVENDVDVEFLSKKKWEKNH